MPTQNDVLVQKVPSQLSRNLTKYAVNHRSTIGARKTRMGEAFFVGWYGSFIMKMKHAELLIVMIPFFSSDFLHATHFSLEANFIQQIMALATANHLFYNYLSKRTIRSRRHNLNAFSPAKTYPFGIVARD